MGEDSPLPWGYSARQRQPATCQTSESNQNTVDMLAGNSMMDLALDADFQTSLSDHNMKSLQWLLLFLCLTGNSFGQTTNQPSFDIEKATRAYLDRIPPEKKGAE